MIDIEKVRTIISNILQEQQLTISVERHNDLVDVLFAFDELKRLQEFKTTFDNYKLSQKQGFIAYENWQECEKQIKELQKKVKSLHVMQTYQCLSCEREIRDTWKYCPYCGVELDWSAE